MTLLSSSTYAPRPGRRGPARRLACLLYHEIAPSGYLSYFSVSLMQFRAQLDRLVELGLRGSSLEDALTSSEPAVAITLDDADATHAAVAWPELERRGMTATFFVTTDWVGKPGHLSWEQLREMAAARMSVQSHTASHPFLSELEHDEVCRELVESKRLLDEKLHQDTTMIALPGGVFPRGWEADDFLRYGYRWVATSRWGPNELPSVPSNMPLVRRYTVRRSTTLSAFDKLIRCASSAFSPEGARLRFLNEIRAVLGVRRYASWRAWLLRARRLQ